jgi:Leucine-rich repeat (LRR) protein
MIISRSKESRMSEELKISESTFTIMLCNAHLTVFPMQILTLSHSNQIRRLDISSNCISALPATISVLSNIRELWLQNNPIMEIPSEIRLLQKLEVLDIRSTKISEIPTEIADIQSLYEIDWRYTPFDERIKREKSISTNDIVGLRNVLKSLNIRKLLETALIDYLLGEHFLMDADNIQVKTVVYNLVEV